MILYANRNTGLLALLYFLQKEHDVKLITEDPMLWQIAENLGVPIVDFRANNDQELFVCVHGRKIIPPEYIKGCMVNIHPCLYKYKGHNPIKRYIEDGETQGSVESHIMTEKVDEGEIIHSEFFDTPKCETYADFYNVAYPYYIKCLDATMKTLCSRS